MSDEPRNWDKELSEIDKLIASSPEPPARPAPVPGRAAPAASAPVRPVAPPLRRRDRAGTWILVLLALALGVALVLWPRFKECGLGLGYFLAADVMLLIVALVAARSAWTRRQGLAHLLALIGIAGAFVIGAREVLPRVGYARVAATWTCPASRFPDPVPQNGTAPANTGL